MMMEFAIRAFIFAIIGTIVTANDVAVDLKTSNNTHSIRTGRNYGMSSNYGAYPESYDNYNSNNNNYGKKYTCCACDSNGSSPLLFFGLGSLLGLLFALPMMLAGAVTPMAMTPAPMPPPPPAAGERFRQHTDREVKVLDRNKRFDPYSMNLNEKIGNETVQFVIKNIQEKPECVKHWFCELYQHVIFIIPRGEMTMVNLLVGAVERMEAFKSCKNLSANYCDKLIRNPIYY